jgi:hypothetical protein
METLLQVRPQVIGIFGLPGCKKVVFINIYVTNATINVTVTRMLVQAILLQWHEPSVHVHEVSVHVHEPSVHVREVSVHVHGDFVQVKKCPVYLHRELILEKKGVKDRIVSDSRTSALFK